MNVHRTDGPREALLIRRRRPIGEPSELIAGPAPGTGLLQGMAGAGRAVQSLAEAGRGVAQVTQLVIDPELTPEALREVDVGRRFERVILGSHLVNTPDEPTRGALLALAARHARADGEVLVEHHPLDWAQTAEATPSTPGADVGMERVERDPPFVSAVTVYDIGGRTLRVPFRARVLSEVELAEELRAAGFASVERLAPTWLLARRGAG